MLLTKFHIPTLNKNVIHRSNLFNKLNEGYNSKLILISAPAGYGKSTIISDWIIQNKVNAAWYSIEKRDNNITEFLKSIIKAVQTIQNEIGISALELLESPQSINAELVIESLINDVLELKKDVFLILDDFHLIELKEILNLVSFLIDYLPQNLHIVLSTRSDPTLQLARLRSQNALIELRSKDLHFSEHDIFELFNKYLKLDLTPDDVRLLESKTEGWIAGLQLAAHTIQGRKNVSDYLKELAGNNRYIMDYLIEEVLFNQPEEVKDFLLKTSILDKFNASLCNDLLQINNSQELLESFEKDNIFIVSLDYEKRWYRYHHLFADLLNRRLFLENNNDIKKIHLKASDWFRQNNFILESVEHALKGENNDKAIKLLNDNVENLWIQGQHASIVEFGNQLPEDKITSNPPFCIFYSWMLITAGKIEKAQRFLVETEKVLNKKNTSEDCKDSLGKLSLTYALLYALLGKKNMVIKYSEQAINNLSDKNPLWNGWAYVTFGDAYLMNANLAESEKSYSLAIENAKKANNQYLYITANFKLAHCLGRHGKYKASAEICKEQLNYINTQENNQVIYENTLAGFYTLYGSLQLEWNNCDIALEYTEKGIELAKKANNISLKVLSYVGLINLYFSIGELEKATSLLEELESDYDFNQTSQWISIHLTAWKAEILLYNNEIEKASDLLLDFKENIKEEINKKPEYIQLRLAKLYIIQRNTDDALKLLDELMQLANDYDKYYLKFYVKVLKAIVYKTLNKKIEAKESLINAIQIAQKEDYIRLFIDEGKELKELLDEIEKDLKTKTSVELESISKEYFLKLMSSFEMEKNRLNAQKESDLSSRELDTLKLIAQNLSNQEIADELFISITTVKTHVRNILSKMGAKNRTDAASKAKENGII